MTFETNKKYLDTTDQYKEESYVAVLYTTDENAKSSKRWLNREVGKFESQQWLKEVTVVMGDVL